MARVYLLLGSNLGDREEMLLKAITHIQTEIGSVVKRSSVYETEPWGFAGQPMFLNQVIRVDTPLTPEELLDATEAIELLLGRTRNGIPQHARLIDIDILFYDQLIYHSSRLTIPHVHLHFRSFTLVPLMEIAPDFIHPVLNISVEELFLRREDHLLVDPYQPFYPIPETK